jgi:hypothetical protein
MEFPSRTAVVIGSFANQSAGSVFDGVKMNVIYKTLPVRITDISVDESFGAGETICIFLKLELFNKLALGNVTSQVAMWRMRKS